MIENLSCAILVQGKYINGYTKEVLLNYLTCLKYLVIFSSWKGDNLEFELRELTESYKGRFFLVLSETPNPSGYQNINYQIVSTLSGLDFARKLNVKYVAKVRSDFSFGVDLFSLYFERVLSKRSILALETVNPLKCIYFISDFLFVGPIFEVEKIFLSSLVQSGDNRPLKSLSNVRIYHADYFRLVDNSNAERFLVVNYLKLTGYIIPHNFAEMSFLWTSILFKHFYLVSPNEVKVTSFRKYDSLNDRPTKFSQVLNYYEKGPIHKKIVSLYVFFVLCNGWLKHQLGNFRFYLTRDI